MPRAAALIDQTRGFMTKRLPLLLLCALCLAACGTTPRANVARTAAPAAPSCDIDRARVLALDEDKFDQDMDGGWRVLADKPGCQLTAADLPRDYRQHHKNEAGLLYWHEAQLRAFNGQPEQAIALMEHARKPLDADRAGWNPYVDATIAFLRRDRAALEQARVKLAAVRPPKVEGAPVVKGGFFEVDLGNGKMQKFPWPPNIDLVDGLINCFDKSYTEAYAFACRPVQG